MDEAFWLRYLRAHADPRTRWLHTAGTLAGTSIALWALTRRDPLLFAASLACGYGPAWFTHAFIERNRPETFSAPLRSLAADYRMAYGLLTNSLHADLARASA